MTELSPELRSRVTEDARNALLEDIGSGDLTAGLVPENMSAQATVVVREAAVLCGQLWFDEVFRQLDSDVRVTWHKDEGARLAADEVVCELAGPARPILTGERSALNFLQTLSATATAARAYSDTLSGTSTVVLDTRKTLPGLRLAQKYAVHTGGGQNHRIGLYDGILIKENHIIASGGVQAAVTAALESAQTLNSGVLVEVEVESVAEAREAMDAGAERLLLDNLSVEDMRTIVGLRDESHPQTTLEASGGVTLDSMQRIASSGVDFISVGDMTKNVSAIDFSMRFNLL